MLGRLFCTTCVNELWKNTRFVLSRVIKWEGTTVSPLLGSCHPQYVLSRPFHTGSPRRQEKMDLDKWKLVMKSQASPVEKEDAEDKDASDDEEMPGEGLNNSLETMREMVALWRLSRRLVPQEMTDEELKTVADLTTKSARKKYLKYLAIKEGHKRSRKEKQQKKAAAREASLEQRKEPDENQKEFKNTFLLQFWGRSLDRHLGWRSAQGMLFDQPLVFDMSYESNMSKREIENTISQLMELEGWNRRANEPYHLHFCNLQPDGPYMKELLKRYGADAWERLLITNTERQAVDLFPRDRLVYLTADSPNVLRTYDHSKVYIIGALVDRSILSGVSLANAKRQKLATARLPLDEFLHWGLGAKNLTLDQMIRIMITIKETGKWEEALKFVPKRKHATDLVSGDYENRSSKSKEQKCKKTSSGEDQSAYKSQRVSGFTWTDKASRPQAAPKVRTSLKTSMEKRRESKSKMWWNDDDV
ncbi:tRNA methyltransferase 10 homolog C [Dunckerocampus dactyliophorus]|uniref:tRNA methyltransferase 10 homolog C n=1 Tax=Dunckerocampus dactyliophorus TaxID=161453 RepID=UPI0024061896|nr:tRNA methyltransferase 10 homolog C [Dunckerocampus dactyliophorus]